MNTTVQDIQQSRCHDVRGIQHHYGNRVFIHSHPYPLSLLARLCSPGTVQPLFTRLLSSLYDYLLVQIVNLELQSTYTESETRMITSNPQAVIRGPRIDPGQPVVTVDIARAGMLPSHRFFQGLHLLLDATSIRQDHVFMNRAVDDNGHVKGVNMSGSKIGGPVSGRTILVPDPMGATGSSMLATWKLFQDQPGGPPARFIAANLIVTPEYLRHLLHRIPDIHIHCIRLDRGLSPPDVLATTPGKEWERERGLNDADYIVPGGGGFGELMNNALE